MNVEKKQSIEKIKPQKQKPMVLTSADYKVPKSASPGFKSPKPIMREE